MLRAAITLMDDRKDTFTALLADETGAPQGMIEALHWTCALDPLKYFAGAVEDIVWSELREASTDRSRCPGSLSAWLARSWRGTCH